MKVFEKYAEYYDLLYQDKDYTGECNFVEEIFSKFSPRPVKTILDAGCGTGGHAITLAERGYRITGVDRSPIMIQRAREKVKPGLNLDLRLIDLLQLDLGSRFDACICMFAVMDYITETKEILKVLGNIRKHMEKGSLFLFDFWNGLAVLRNLPSVRVKTVESKEKRIVRIAEPELNAVNHLCYVHYRLLLLQNDTLVDEIEETHNVRYFFPLEITHYLEDSGFELLKICPFLNLEGKADENEWNTIAIARAV